MARTTRVLQQGVELGVGGGILHLRRERTEFLEARGSHVELARVDDHGGEALLPGRSPRSQVAPDENDPSGVDLGLCGDRVEHLRHDVLPIRSHRDPSVVEHRALTGSVKSCEGVAAGQGVVDGGEEFLGGAESTRA
jgi:hypothetical protein